MAAGTGPVTVSADVRSLLASMRGLPRDINRQIRAEARAIAERAILPHVIDDEGLTGRHARHLRADTRTKSDRLPTVLIGKARRSYSGGASTYMTRYATHQRYSWVGRSRAQWGDDALAEIRQAVGRIIARWNADSAAAARGR
jgi:hypothetical protein